MAELSLLKFLGLSDYEAQVYLALIKAGRVRVRDLIPLVSVPRAQIYGTLKSLCRRGLCKENPGQFLYYSPLPPETALGALWHEKDAQLKMLKDLIKQLGEFYASSTRNSTTEVSIEVLKGPHLTTFMVAILKEAKQDVKIFVRQMAVTSRQKLKYGTQQEIKLLRRGVRVRCIYDEEHCIKPQGKIIALYLNQVVRAGEEARVFKGLPMNLLVVDNRVATFSLRHPTNNEVTMYAFHHPELVQAFSACFEYYWERSKRLSAGKT